MDIIHPMSSPRYLAPYPAALQRAIASGDHLRTAIEFAKMGRRVLPVHSIDEDGRCTCRDENCRHPGKHPDVSLAGRGVKDATCDPGVAWEWWAPFPDRNIGLALGNGLAVLDRDARKGADFSEYFGLPEDGLREQSGGGGDHVYYAYDPGVHLRSGAIPGTDVEWKAEGTHVVMAPGVNQSGPYVNPDPSRPIPLIPDDWPLLGHFLTVGKSPRLAPYASRPTRGDHAAARRVIFGMLRGRYGENLRKLFEGRWQEVQDEDGKRRYLSRSEADQSFLFAATWYTDNPRVLDAVMRQSKLCRPKWLTNRYYRAICIEKALTLRAAQRDRPTAWLRSAFAQAGMPFGDDPNLPPDGGAGFAGQPLDVEGEVTETKNPAPSTPTVFVAQPVSRESIVQCIMAIARGEIPDLGRNDGWYRVPVDDLATCVGRHRNTIANAIKDAAARGMVETTCRPVTINGQIRRDRLVRLPRAE